VVHVDGLGSVIGIAMVSAITVRRTEWVCAIIEPAPPPTRPSPPSTTKPDAHYSRTAMSARCGVRDRATARDVDHDERRVGGADGGRRNPPGDEVAGPPAYSAPGWAFLTLAAVVGISASRLTLRRRFSAIAIEAECRSEGRLIRHDSGVADALFYPLLLLDAMIFVGLPW